jgi:Glycosyl transferase family 2
VRVWVFCHARNEAAWMPFFLRHYSSFAEQIHVFDDGSTDGTRAIVQAHPKAVLHDIPFTGLDELALLDLAYHEYPKAINHADLVMWPDVDEFIYHPDIITALKRHLQSGYDCVRPLGFNMMGSVPVDDGHSQIWELLRTGIRAEVYSKPVIFRPECGIRWAPGKHKLADPKPRRAPEEDPTASNPWRIKLLHYRYLTEEYTRIRSARQYDRSTSKGTAWGCAPEYTGEHSAAWVTRVLPFAYDVVADDACYRDTPETRELYHL